MLHGAPRAGRAEMKVTVGNLEFDVAAEQVAAVHNVIVENFLQEISRESVIRMSDIILTETDRLLEETQQQRKPNIACRSGCFWCCRVEVSATCLEVLYITEYILSHFSMEEVAQIQERVGDVVRRRSE